MTEITLRISDESMLPWFRKMIRSMEGVEIVPAKRKRKSGIEQALEDVAAGRVTEWNSAEEMFRTLMAES